MGATRLIADVPNVRQAGLAETGALSAQHHLVLTFGLPLRHEAILNSFIALHASHGQYLTQSQFAHRFSPTRRQINALYHWTSSHGMRTMFRSPDGLAITVEAPARTVEHVLSVHLERLQRKGISYFANTTAPAVPARLGIESITGLDDLTQAQHVPVPRTARSSDVPFDGFIPSQIRRAYDLAGHEAQGQPINAAGQTIGITDVGQAVPDSDLKSFASATNDPAICTTCKDKVEWDLLGGRATQDNDILEQALDVEYAHGLALNSTIKVWMGDGATPTPPYDGSNASMEDALDAAANDPSIHVVSNSWSEPGIRRAKNPFVRVTQNIFKHAVAVGTTFYFATGDNAADSGCYYKRDSDVTQPCGLAAYPADSPYVIAVGGTNLQMNSNFTSWTSEQAWNLDRSIDQGGGGGCTTMFKRPAWQRGVFGATCRGRAIPDVSATADVDNSPVEVWVDGGPEPVGGTSVATPLLAALAADTNQYLSIEHAVKATVPSTMGFAAPEIYKLANSSWYDSYFHDVLCGSIGHPAARGWDEATGWGSIDWYNFTQGIAGQRLKQTSPPASWSCTEGSGTARRLLAISCSDKYVCDVGTGAGSVLLTKDGWHWSDKKLSSNSGVSALACSKQETCYALLANGTFRFSLNGGASWQSRKSGLAAGASMACPKVEVCYAGGNAMAKTVNAKTFKTQSVPVSGPFNAISCPTIGVCYAVASGSTIIRTTDGKTWTVVFKAPTGLTLNSLSCPSPSACVAVGSISAGSVVYHLSSAGAWKAGTVPDIGSLTSVSCPSHYSCEATSSSGQVVRSVSSGASWYSVNPLSGSGQSLNAVDCPSKFLCYAVGDNGQIHQLGATAAKR